MNAPVKITINKSPTTRMPPTRGLLNGANQPVNKSAPAVRSVPVAPR